MADEDTRSSGGGLAQEDDKMPGIETDVDSEANSPGIPGSSHLGQHPDHDLDQPLQGQRASSPTSSSRTPLLDIHKGRPIRLQVRVLVPIKDHPNYNFVGKLLGPKGNSLKRLQEETQTKMAILGRGSMRDRAKEEELRATGDPKHGHLRDDLHVEITAFAPAAEAYARMAHALAEVKRFLVPDYYDEIRQNQLRELAVLNGNRKRGGKAPLPEGTDFEEGVVTPQQQDGLRQTHYAQQQQRLQVPVNGSSGHPPPGSSQSPGPPAGARPIRCGLVTRAAGAAALVSRAVRTGPHRGHPSQGPHGLVRSFVTSVCGSGTPTLFREVTIPSSASGQEATRIQYLAEDDAFTFEEGFGCGEPHRAEEFSIRSSQAYIGHEYRDDEDGSDGIYEARNGYTASKEFIGEDWPQAKVSPVQAPVGALRAGPSAGRLKSVSPGSSVRPARTIYREHPYFPAAVARY